MNNKPGKPVRRALGIILIGLAVIIGLEIAVRILALAPKLKHHPGGMYIPDPHLPYRMKPRFSLEAPSGTGEFRVSLRHNYRGLRDIERPREKPAGSFRILAVGDSFTYGAGAPFEETYLVILEQMLNKRYQGEPEIDIIKAGIGGFFPEAERLLVRHYGLAYDPDLLLIGFNDTDVLETYMGIAEFKTDNLLASQSHLVRLFLKYRQERRYARLTVEHRQHLDEIWDRIGDELRLMKDLLTQRGKETVVCYIPNRESLDPVAGSGDSGNIFSRLQRVCRAEDILLIDTRPDLARQARAGAVYWEKDGHCTPRGYRAIAGAVYAALVADDFIGRATGQ